MKKLLRSAVTLCLCLALVLAAVPASAARELAYKLPDFEYVNVIANNYKHYNLPVYSGPTTRSWRGARSKASVSTLGTIWACGWEDGWLLVMYQLNDSNYRVGFIRGSLFNADAILPGQELNLAYESVRVTTACALTDDPITASRTTTTIEAGTTVTYLASYGGWSYVEVPFGKNIARGFVNTSYLELPDSLYNTSGTVAEIPSLSQLTTDSGDSN